MFKKLLLLSAVAAGAWLATGDQSDARPWRRGYRSNYSAPYRGYSSRSYSYSPYRSYYRPRYYNGGYGYNRSYNNYRPYSSYRAYYPGYYGSRSYYNGGGLYFSW